MTIKWEPLPGTLVREEHENANDGHHMQLRDDGWYDCNQCVLWIYRENGAVAR